MYEIDIKKGDTFINLSSDDVTFIAKQMDQWMHLLAKEGYIPTPTAPSLPASVPVQATVPQPELPFSAPPIQAAPPVNAAPPPTPVIPAPASPAPVAPPPQAPVQEVVPPPPPTPEPVAEAAPSPAPAPAPVYETPVAPPIPAIPVPPEPPPPSPGVEPVASAPVESTVPTIAPPMMEPMTTDNEIEAALSSLLSEESGQPAMAYVPAEPVAPEMPVVSEPAAAPVPAPIPAAVAVAHPQPTTIDSDVKDDFESVMDTLMKDLEGTEDLDAQAPAADISAYQQQAYEAQQAAAFQEQLAYQQTQLSLQQAMPQQPMQPVQTIQPPTMPAPDLSTVGSLAELCDLSRANSREDFLLMAGYFVSNYEGAEKFSLKRLNAVLIKSGMNPANHSDLEMAVAKQNFVLMPDMTGTAEASEYTLTDAGKSYCLGLL